MAQQAGRYCLGLAGPSAAPGPDEQPGTVTAGSGSLWGRKRLGVRRVEGLYACLVVAVERRHRAVRAQAEVVRRGISEPDAHPVEIHTHAGAIDERGRKGFLDNQL